MRIRQVNKFLMVTISLLVLIGCDNYKIVKWDEVKEFSYKMTFDDFNLSSKIKIKYMDERLHYQVELGDIDEEPIEETDYYGRLSKKSIVLMFFDEDDFLLLETNLPVEEFSRKTSNETLIRWGTLESKESTYLKIHDSKTGLKS